MVNNVFVTFTDVWALLTLMIEQDFVNFVHTPLYPSLLSCKVPSWHSQLYFVTNLQDKLHMLIFQVYVIRFTKIFFFSAILYYLI